MAGQGASVLFQLGPLTSDSDSLVGSHLPCRRNSPGSGWGQRFWGAGARVGWAAAGVKTYDSSGWNGASQNLTLGDQVGT